jgi:DivIVA domain-containing protein
MRRKKAEDQAVPARADGRITPTDVQQVEFRLAFRGYKERDVDAFLDRITEDLSVYLEENERLRSGAGLPAAPASAVAPAGVEADARAEAGAIVAAAREEAAAIVRRAEQEAAAVRAGASGDPRAAIAPFLSREREFLESLGGLVQGHAEEIKRMVLAVRTRTEASRPASQDPAEASGAPGELAVAEGASAAEIRERLGEPEPEEAPEPGPVIIESATEPVYAPEGPKADDERERSLRELFWGED